jgi:hypothetical protein
VRSPRDPRPPRARLASRINSNGRGGRPFPRDHAWDFAASPALPRFTSCCATRTFPSRIYFNRRTNFNPKKGSHARASNVPEPGNSDWLRHHPAECRDFARVSRNVATTAGLHARCLAAVRWGNPRREQDRGLLTAKYSATQRSVPRGFCTRRCAFTRRGSRLWAKTLRSRLWDAA